MANETVTIIDTAQCEVEREDYLFMMDCFDACEEAKQNEKMLKMELNIARVKLSRMEDNGMCSGTDYDATMEQIVRLDLALSQVWAKYHRMIYGE